MGGEGRERRRKKRQRKGRKDRQQTDRLSSLPLHYPLSLELLLCPNLNFWPWTFLFTSDGLLWLLCNLFAHLLWSLNTCFTTTVLDPFLSLLIVPFLLFFFWRKPCNALFAEEIGNVYQELPLLPCLPESISLSAHPSVLYPSVCRGSFPSLSNIIFSSSSSLFCCSLAASYSSSSSFSLLILCIRLCHLMGVKHCVK